MSIDLESMDLKELRDLKQKVDRAINDFESRQRQKAVDAAKEVAEKFGFKLTDLLNSATSKKPVVAKYANPEDTSQTWTGRGRQPQWVKDQLANGASLEDLAI
ncbi:H-NS family nucleoid-associated regulatory protein [Paracoccus sp. MKU1]|uniref:H-NS histone family protein n=1 Tax=Paracoccus sp. MKU1 TaxID=1745182 RepID=UPI000719341E|nr:H-NS histone family protein [Paracoccus sp. MKU1]KRW97002.1 hypothetical protein AQY21_05990 [Paracoccus sp. MKU1]